jgi:hypothetical protein
MRETSGSSTAFGRTARLRNGPISTYLRAVRRRNNGRTCRKPLKTLAISCTIHFWNNFSLVRVYSCGPINSKTAVIKRRAGVCLHARPGGKMSEVLHAFYCAGYYERGYPIPPRKIEDPVERQYAREAYRSGRKDYQRQEIYLRLTGRIH